LCFMCDQCWIGWPIPSLISCVLCVINVEPVDLSPPSFLCCVLCEINVTGSTLITHKTQYRNEGRDRSTGSTLITHKTQHRNEGRHRSTGSTLTTYKTQYIPSLISILCAMCDQCWTVDLSLPSFLYCVLCVINIEPVDLSLPAFLYCVLQVVNVEPVDVSLPSFLFQHWSHIKYKKWGKW
jgi:hypothetical protein